MLMTTKETQVMKPLKSLALALMALFAVSMASSSAAMAEPPEILPAPTAEKPLIFTSKTKAGAKPYLETEKLLRLACEKATSKGSLSRRTKARY
jgi:hypothetical protein